MKHRRIVSGTAQLRRSRRKRVTFYVKRRGKKRRKVSFLADDMDSRPIND